MKEEFDDIEEGWTNMQVAPIPERPIAPEVNIKEKTPIIIAEPETAKSLASASERRVSAASGQRARRAYLNFILSFVAHTEPDACTGR